MGRREAALGKDTEGVTVAWHKLPLGPIGVTVLEGPLMPARDCACAVTPLPKLKGPRRADGINAVAIGI